MTKTEYTTSGTCSRKISFALTPDGKVTGINFEGGCNGNLKAVAALCEGLGPQEIAEKLTGIECGAKGTSCADQLAKAVMKAQGAKN